MKSFFRKIMGLTLITILLVTSAMPAHAIYSPRIAERVSIIKQNLRTARQIHGNATFTEVAEFVAKQNKEREKEGGTTGVWAQGSLAYGVALKDMIADFFSPHILSFLDPLAMIFNVMFTPETFMKTVSECLRDDIFMLEELRDEVVNEMVKTYFMWDGANGDKLWKDYQFLRDHIRLLKTHGGIGSKTIPSSIAKNYLEPDSGLRASYEILGLLPTTKEYLFGSRDAIDYYKIAGWKDDRACPVSDFFGAIEDVTNAWDKMEKTMDGVGKTWIWSDLDKIKEIAQDRARKRAREWIAANQISLSLAGEEGGSRQSLFGGEGGIKNLFEASNWTGNKFIAEWKTNTAIISNMGFSLLDVFPCFDVKDEALAKSLMKSEHGALLYRFCTDTDRELCEAEEEKGLNTHCLKWNTPELTDIQKLGYVQEAAKSKQSSFELGTKIMKYNFLYTQTSEAALVEADKSLRALETEVRRVSELDGTQAGKLLPSFCENVQHVIKTHCANKPDPPDPINCR